MGGSVHATPSSCVRATTTASCITFARFKKWYLRSNDTLGSGIGLEVASVVNPHVDVTLCYTLEDLFWEAELQLDYHYNCEPYFKGIVLV